MEINKLLKASKKAVIELIIIVPITLSLLLVFGIYEKIMNEPIFYYAFWSGLPIAFIMGLWFHYDEENKI